MFTSSHYRQTPLPTARGKQLVVRAAGHSIAGTRNTANQDRFLTDECRAIFMVADGMGGMLGGERAAQMATDLLSAHPALIGCEVLDRETIRCLISQAFCDVNLEIVSAADNDPILHGMGTTAVLAMLVGQQLYMAGLGDSRAYLLRDGSLHQYTTDHSMAQTLVQMGAITREMARRHSWRHKLWKYLGAADLHEGPEVSVLGVLPGDRILLVTDGVTEVLRESDIINVMASHATSAAASEGVVRAAVSRGTRDDATCVVIDFHDAAACC